MRLPAFEGFPLKILEYQNIIGAYVDEIVHVILFTTTIFVNKYVLSILKFTYPTVFQGWQTLVGVVILKFLTWKGKPKLVVTPLDKNGTISILPHVIFYVGSIVAGSKALSSLPIPVFLSACNLAPASIFLLDSLPQPLCKVSSITLIPAFLTLMASACVLFLCDAEFPNDPNGGDSPYFWMLVHVVLLTAQSLHDRVVDPRFSQMDLLFYANLFGVVILAPASLYLQEAFLALQFRHRRQLHFLVGCLLSGVLGLLLRIRTAAASSTSDSSSLHATSLKEKPGEEDCIRKAKPVRGAIAGLFASIVGFLVFPGLIPENGVLLAAGVSLVAALFIPPIDLSRDDASSLGGQEPWWETEERASSASKSQPGELHVV
ncbi:transmembrane protein 241-like [Ischnura elegans]|uniref:transmembrane protein 241-like n=1 Tax=Ischnura elegans TaxID=197161 RepID=UPI001ED8A5AA|nr:transmembrane protein 241-like [Ischnura elegans]